MLHQPAYTRFHVELGEITTYPPGYKENAGIFCHNNPWIMIAETLAGNGEAAWEYYRKICPPYLEEISELQLCTNTSADRIVGQGPWTIINWPLLRLRANCTSITHPS